MKKNINRNDPCLCGSGKKYKHCCEGKKTKKSNTRYSLVILTVAVILVGFLLIKPNQDQGARGGRPGQVWSEEHGHWHDAPAGRNAAVPQKATRPPGPAPEGKVWSEEHGHWHDIPDNQTRPAQSTTGSNQPAPAPQKATRPPGPAPEGKVWSEEHGHWHDIAPQQTTNPQPKATRPPGPAPEGKVWSEEHGHWHNAPVQDTVQ